MSDIFSELRKSIKKTNKNIHCEIMNESSVANISEYVSMPNKDLNRILSGNLSKGLPSKAMTLLVGVEHSFKSSLMILTARNAQKRGFKPIIIDTEGGITSGFSKRWGLDTENSLYIYSPWAEEINSTLAKIKESGEEKFCIILDSIGGISKLKTYDDALSGKYKQDMGGNARVIKSILKLLTNICKTQNSIAVVSSHFYSQSGLIPMPDSVVGGKAVLLMPDIILYLKKASKKDTEKFDSDKRVNVSCIKNRFYPANKSGIIDIDYVNGLNEYSGLLDFAVKNDIIEQKGASYSIGEVLLGRGIKQALKKIENDKEIRTLFLNTISEHLENTGFSDENKKNEVNDKQTESLKKQVNETENQKSKEMIWNKNKPFKEQFK